MDESNIPGFTAEQSWSMEMLIERAVSKGIADGMAHFQESNCADHQARTDHLETLVFGRTERGIVGLDQRMAAQESETQALTKAIDDMVGDRKWFRRMVYSALFVSCVGLVFGLIQFAITRGW